MLANHLTYDEQAYHYCEGYWASHLFSLMNGLIIDRPAVCAKVNVSNFPLRIKLDDLNKERCFSPLNVYIHRVAKSWEEKPLVVRCPNCKQVREPDYNETTRRYLCPICASPVDAQVLIEKRKRGIK
jgi:hypothetical protein